MNLVDARILIPVLIGVLLAVCAHADEAGAPAPPIGPTKIPFYTGNTSVHVFMQYWGTREGPPGDLVTPQRIELLKRISCFADCDYPAWSVTEQEPDKWDFGTYRANADALHDADLKYIIFCWVHFPPKWFLEREEFVPYKSAEYGYTIPQLSPWAPNVLDIYRRFYRAQHDAMGDKVDWVRIATPADYGEIGYPAGMTNWLVPQEHGAPGYWCGDEYAMTDFRNQMKQQFQTLDVLNKRWGTSFESWDAVGYPELKDEAAAAKARKTGKPEDRRRWLDFVEWYYGFWLRFVPELTAVVSEFYPDNPKIVSVGYASEITKFGNDYSAIPKMAKQIGVAMQTPGNVPYYAMKRVSTACHFYGCPYYTEPPGNVPLEKEIARVFNDVSNGVQVYFEYPANLDRARTELREYKDHMTGAKPLVDVAIFNPAVEHRLECGKDNFPMKAYLLGEEGRDKFDFDVIDENLIRDGALGGYRVLAYVQGSITEEFALRKIIDWVKDGGALVTCGLGDVETVEGDAYLWKSLVPDSWEEVDLEQVLSGGGIDRELFKKLCTRRVGRGIVLRAPAPSDRRDVLIPVMEKAAHHLKDFGEEFENAPLIDGVDDGIRATLLADRILYHNPTADEITKSIVLRPADWQQGEKKPEAMEYELKLAPHSIEAIMLK